MWSSWDDVKETYRAWTTWDDWILATYRERIDFQSFFKQKTRSLTPEQKDYILSTGLDNPKSPRNAILRAIKSNDKGENYNRQTGLYIFAKLCVLLICTSSGFVISNILGAHLGLKGALEFGVALVSFTACFLSNLISYRISVPGVIRKLFEWDNFGWHFLAKKEISIYRDPANKKVRTGYKYTDEEKINGAEGNYGETPGKDQDLGWKSNLFLMVQFVLVTIVGLAILAQTVDKAGHGMKGILPFLIGVNVANPLAWAMGGAAFVCMLGQYTFSVIRFLRQKDKTKELRAVFKSVDPEKKNYGEVYAYNFMMGVVALGLSVFVALGMYGTSDVQAASFMKMVHASKDTVGHIAICVCSVAGKAIFTVRAMINFIGIIRATAGATLGWMMGKGYHSPFNKREAEDVVSKPGYVAICLSAMAKSTTAVPTPDPGEKSELYSHCAVTQFFAWAAVVGGFIRTAQEPLDKLKPKDTTPPAQNKNKPVPAK